MKSSSRSINTYTSIVTENWIQCRLTANININFTKPASVPTQASTNKCVDCILTRTSVNAGSRFTFLRKEIITHWLHSFKTHYLFIHFNSKCKRLNLEMRKRVLDCFYFLINRSLSFGAIFYYIESLWLQLMLNLETMLVPTN